MILAAGRGERLRPLTDQVPKPMVEVAGQPLIFHHMDALASAGYREIVINIAHLGGQIREAVGNGERWGVNVRYSQEPEGALETGGGIAYAIELLGSGPFLVLNGDIYCDYSHARLRAVKCDYAHLVLVPVPEWRDEGDFSLQRGRVRNAGAPKWTFSGISVYHPRFFRDAPSGNWSIVPLLRQTIDDQLVTGEVHNGAWHDAGTPERLAELRSSTD